MNHMIVEEMSVTPMNLKKVCEISAIRSDSLKSSVKRMRSKASWRAVVARGGRGGLLGFMEICIYEFEGKERDSGHG